MRLSKVWLLIIIKQPLTKKGKVLANLIKGVNVVKEIESQEIDNQVKKQRIKLDEEKLELERRRIELDVDKFKLDQAKNVEK